MNNNFISTKAGDTNIQFSYTLSTDGTYYLVTKARNTPDQDDYGSMLTVSETKTVEAETSSQEDTTPPNWDVVPECFWTDGNKTKIELDWGGKVSDNVSVTKYDIFMNGIKCKTGTTETMEEIIVTVPGGTYSFFVRAYDAANNYSDSPPVSPQGTGTIELPADFDTYSTEKKVQFYLDYMGFETGGVDGLFGVKSSPGLILLQYYLGSSYVTGEINTTTYNQVKNAAESGITYNTIDAYLALHPAGSSSISKVTSTNGYQDTTTMARIPTDEYTSAYLERNSAIAWAIMVDAARKAGYGVSVFSAQNETSGYRSYHYQVEAYVKERKVVGAENASNPYFTKGTTLEDVLANELRSTNDDANNSYAEAWIDNCEYDSSLGWNNVPDSATEPGGDLYGYGGSNHGWGLALDMNIHASDGNVYSWLVDNASQYGFGPETGEEWHWNYNR